VRRFKLLRHCDHPPGRQATGIVAEGIQFSDGATVIRWLGAYRSTVTWDNVEDAETVYNHDGATEVVWLDHRPPVAALRVVEDDERNPL
jgi:hypothetical protein